MTTPIIAAAAPSAVVQFAAPAAAPAATGAGVIAAAAGSPVANIYKDLMAEYKMSQASAKAANEARYQEALTGSRARYDRGMQTAAFLGQQDILDVNEAAARTRAQSQQAAVSRGMYNTTVLDTDLRTVEDGRQKALTQAAADNRVLRIGVDARLSADTLELIERREDAYPSWTGLVDLARQYGQSKFLEEFMEATANEAGATIPAAFGI